MNCEACTTAHVNPLSGIYNAGCTERAARALAQSPQFFDAVAAKAMTPAYRSALQQLAGEDWLELHKEVKRWNALLESEK